MKEPLAEAVVGRNGLAWGYGFDRFGRVGEPRKREGDGRSPAGVFRLGRRFGFAGGAGRDFLGLSGSTLCIDDPHSRHYNRIVDSARLRRDWRSAERMSAVPSYRRGIEVLYPTSARVQAGSCIFIHEWDGDGRGTAGCVAAAPEVLESLHRDAVGEGRSSLLVILPEAKLAAFATCWPPLGIDPAAPAARR